MLSKNNVINKLKLNFGCIICAIFGQIINYLFQSKSILAKGKVKFHNLIFLFNLNPVQTRGLFLYLSLNCLLVYFPL